MMLYTLYTLFIHALTLPNSMLGGAKILIAYMFSPLMDSHSHA